MRPVPRMRITFMHDKWGRKAEWSMGAFACTKDNPLGGTVSPRRER